MRHDAGFLEAICANPDDDVPRLIFADWLEERGDPRGEFIRWRTNHGNLPNQASLHPSTTLFPSITRGTCSGSCG
jgi:uncharacterized protein (TIGR02996 family)